TVEGELRERVGGTRSLTVEADRHEVVAGAAALAAGGEIHIKAGTALVLEGGDVTLRGPGGFVRIDGGGVTIDGAAVKIKQGGAPGAGHGAHPALPVVPLRSDEERARRRLPLVEVPAIPKEQWPNRGRPLNPDELFICGLLCECASADPPALCVRRQLQAIDRSAGGMSPYKPEVPYDMSKTPPEPIMSNNDPSRPTTKNPSGSKIPDVVVVNDPSKPPTQDNIKEVIEIKFRDRLTKDQIESYRDIAGSDEKLRVLDPDECGCPMPKRRKIKLMDVVAGVAAAVVALLLLRLLLRGPFGPVAPATT
ncbi:MAG: hypothetical protein IT372_03625, partial [Polyangiaceae bacterium]|nr:hypothetical protein [Polyangiaceae bacterium]